MAYRRSSVALAYESNLLDDINRRLLDELQRDGRAPFAELGRRVGLSAPAVAERVGRLEREGVITGQRAQLEGAPRAWPLPAGAHASRDGRDRGRRRAAPGAKPPGAARVRPCHGQ